MHEIIQSAQKSIVVERNKFLAVKGEINTNVYFVESGSLMVFVLNNGEEQIIRFGYKNNLIAVLDSYLTGKPTNFYVKAIKKTVVKVIAKKQIEEFLNDESKVKIWIKAMEELIVQQMEREVDLLTKSPAQRYLRVLKRSPRLFQEIPNKHIANYLRMSPETLSRLKKS